MSLLASEDGTPIKMSHVFGKLRARLEILKELSIEAHLVYVHPHATLAPIKQYAYYDPGESIPLIRDSLNRIGAIFASLETSKFEIKTAPVLPNGGEEELLEQVLEELRLYDSVLKRIHDDLCSPTHSAPNATSKIGTKVPLPLIKAGLRLRNSNSPESQRRVDRFCKDLQKQKKIGVKDANKLFNMLCGTPSNSTVDWIGNKSELRYFICEIGSLLASPGRKWQKVEGLFIVKGEPINTDNLKTNRIPITDLEFKELVDRFVESIAPHSG